MIRWPLIVVALIISAGVALSRERASGLITPTSYDADVNKDGSVTAGDLGWVAHYFGAPPPTPTATAVPPMGTPLSLAREVVVQNHTAAWLGAYQSPRCHNAVLILQSAGLESLTGTFDFLVAPSLDGVTPGGVSNIGNSSPEGTADRPAVYRKRSANESDVVEQTDYGDDSYPWLMVGVFANQTGRFSVDVYCANTG
jgi:hypothetical protein